MGQDHSFGLGQYQNEQQHQLDQSLGNDQECPTIVLSRYPFALLGKAETDIPASWHFFRCPFHVYIRKQIH